MKNNEELLFNLQLQKVIEFIKEGKVDTALEFARKELMPMVEKNVYRVVCRWIVTYLVKIPGKH